MDIAEAELGVQEESLPGHDNKRIIEFHSTTTLKATNDETAWCSSFANWVMKKAGYQGTKSAAAKSWLEWGTELTTPRVGAIVVVYSEAMKRKGYSGYHVAFWLSENATHVKLLGGNQGTTGMVKVSNYPLAKDPEKEPLKGWQIKGYRWPG
jgi:uncharacterized protein (TIGR02594 family)